MLFQSVSVRNKTRALSGRIPVSLVVFLSLIFGVSSAFAACPSQSGSGNFYVDGSNFCGVGCSDSGPGSASSPWCSVNKALMSLSAGQSAHVFPGTYDLSSGPGLDSSGDLRPVRSGTASQPIKLVAHSTAGDIVGKPELFDEGSLVFLIGSRLIADKDHWDFSGLFFKGGSGFMCEGASNLNFRNSLVLVDIDWRHPEIMPDLDGADPLTFSGCSNFEIDTVEAYSVVTDRTACSYFSEEENRITSNNNIEQVSTSIISISGSNNFSIKNSVIYGGRNTQYINTSSNFTIENTTYFGGQEHLEGINEDSHNWALRNSLILPGPGQEFWIQFKPRPDTCYHEPRITNGEITNNLFLSGPSPKFTTSGTVQCDDDYSGQISDIILRNNLKVHHRFASHSVFAGSNERDANAIDSDYNLLWDVLPRASWPNQPYINFWNIFQSHPNNQLKLSLILEDWQQQGEYPQISQDQNSKHYYTRSLEGIDPGFMTSLTQFEDFGYQQFENLIRVNSIIPQAECYYDDYATNLVYPYRTNLRIIDYRLKEDSPIRDFVGDPNYNGGKVGPYWLYSAGTPTPTPTATQTPTPTITPTIDPRGEDDATPTPRAESTAKPTPIPTVTGTPNASGIVVGVSGRSRLRAGRTLRIKVSAVSERGSKLSLSLVGNLNGGRIKQHSKVRRGKSRLNATIRIKTDRNPASSILSFQVLVSDGIAKVSERISATLVSRQRETPTLDGEQKGDVSKGLT
ncbi:MAG: hypothetical protein KDD42_02445 [Bdellovibrionales bacterium]|nr:hypothetical protein [Bdellovibrionales bacterium]